MQLRASRLTAAPSEGDPSIRWSGDRAARRGGVASPRDIDKALKLGLNHPMGPFELVDLVGLDTRLSILEYLHRTMGEKYRPCPLLAQYVKAGRLGRKVGRGVYEY